MIITIYSLDEKYKKRVKVMGGHIRTYKSVDDVDVTFFTDEGITFTQTDVDAITFSNGNDSITLTRVEYAEIKIT